MWEENEKGRLSSSNLLAANQSIKEKKMEREKKVLHCFLGHADMCMWELARGHIKMNAASSTPLVYGRA